MKLYYFPIARNPTRERKKEIIVCRIKALFPLLIAALLVATAGPATAKKDQKSQQGKTAAQKRLGKDCFTTAPPFMRNPRFMNRGFFKKKCKTK